MVISFSKSKDVAQLFFGLSIYLSSFIINLTCTEAHYDLHFAVCKLLKNFPLFIPLYINPVMNTCACGLADSARCSRFNEMLVCTQELPKSQRGYVFILWVFKVLRQRNTTVTLSDGVLELSRRTPADPIKTFAWMCLYMHLWCAWVCCLWRILG